MEKKYYIGRDSDRGYDLYHHGILGMKWGIRRYQNEDGSLTDEGIKRYRDIYAKQYGKEHKSLSKELYNKSLSKKEVGGTKLKYSDKKKLLAEGKAAAEKLLTKKYGEELIKYYNVRQLERNDTIKQYVKNGAIIGTGLLASVALSALGIKSLVGSINAKNAVSTAVSTAASTAASAAAKTAASTAMNDLKKILYGIYAFKKLG